MRFWLSLSLCLAACDSSTGRSTGTSGGRSDGGAHDLSIVTLNGDAGPTMSCAAGAPDQSGCGCPNVGAVRACYPTAATPNTRGIGACKDGTQTCDSSGEFSGWSDCTGATTPTAEVCNDQIDNNCDGTIDCADPTCATDPSCNSGCTDGQTRDCYTGPSGTEGVGTCKGGTQTCSGGKWPSDCPGQVLPAAEDCTDARDHNCNYLPGCLDFSCILTPGCQSNCTMANLDSGCQCPDGAGDTATCPDGFFGKPKMVGGSLIPMDQCCPCTAGDCGNAGCCAETVCAGNAQCAGLTCTPLPSSCMGRVDMDCDDFPEDCDEPCCKCTSCSSM
jgi:hypothetical protein